MDRPEIVVPALALRTEDGRLDESATAGYARRAAATWVDRFILSGSTTAGSTLSEAERAAVLDLWRALTPAARLLACCWSETDLSHAVRRGIDPIVVMRDLADRDAGEAFLRNLPAGSYVYSHPAHSRVVLDASLCTSAIEAGHLPAGVKAAKVGPDELRAIRAAVLGRRFTVWDASSRDVRSSVAAGASGVVATPLAPFAGLDPPRDLATLQRAVDEVQRQLDRLGSARARRDYLHSRAVQALSGRP